MWRALFALVHADDVVTDEEVRLMAGIMEDMPFSRDQMATLGLDCKVPQDIEQMFKGITDPKDQAAFFRFARDFVHADGDYGAEEQAILLKLQELHVKSTNLDDLVGRVDLELEGAEMEQARSEGRPPFETALYSFRDAFLERLRK